MKRLTLTIHGKVQGVNFRSFVEDAANRLGLVGWVHNNADGTVTVLAEGEDEPLRELWDLCSVGPEFAEVSKVEEMWEDIDEKSFDEFRMNLSK